MFEADIKRKSLDDWRAGISRKFRRRLIVAQEDIRRDWINELNRQRLTFVAQGRWEPLSTEYEKRKTSEYNRGKIPYNSMLKRTGEMLAGYVGGITFEVTKGLVSVAMPYPGDAYDLSAVDFSKNGVPRAGPGTKARAHQEGPRRRPFDVDAFLDIAWDRLNEAMRSAAE
jgi:hypothetical protein